LSSFMCAWFHSRSNCILVLFQHHTLLQKKEPLDCLGFCCLTFALVMVMSMFGFLACAFDVFFSSDGLSFLEACTLDSAFAPIAVEFICVALRVGCVFVHGVQLESLSNRENNIKYEPIHQSKRRNRPGSCGKFRRTPECIDHHRSSNLQGRMHNPHQDVLRTRHCRSSLGRRSLPCS